MKRLTQPTYAAFEDFDATLPAGTLVEVIGYEGDGRVAIVHDGEFGYLEADNLEDVR